VPIRKNGGPGAAGHCELEVSVDLAPGFGDRETVLRTGKRNEKEIRKGDDL